MKVKVHGWWFPEVGSGCADSILADLPLIESAWLPHVRGRRVCIQAGGNVGIYPSKLAEHFEAVYTAEPDVDNFSCMALNASKDRIYAFRAAFGDKPGTVGLHKTAENAGGHWIDGAGDIPVMTIDSLGLPCDLIALDVEGAELLALKGAEATIMAHRPTIIAEDKGHVSRFGHTPEDAHRWLLTRGYRNVAVAGRDRIWAPQ